MTLGWPNNWSPQLEMIEIKYNNRAGRQASSTPNQAIAIKAMTGSPKISTITGAGEKISFSSKFSSSLIGGSHRKSHQSTPNTAPGHTISATTKNLNVVNACSAAERLTPSASSNRNGAWYGFSCITVWRTRLGHAGRFQFAVA